MNLESQLKKELWVEVKRNYENEIYSSSILDAIYFLGDLIRNKSGLESDGANLIGQAFGGDNPKIKINKLQTESEKNIQKGIEQILRGLYQAIRNPRSHDKLDDNQIDADSIIHFINYLIGIIEKSSTSFNSLDFLKRVFDKHYVNNDEYSNLLVNEIPKRKRLDIGIDIINKRCECKQSTLKSFMHALINTLEDQEIEKICDVITDELKFTENTLEMTTIFNILPFKYWNKVNKAVRLRIEGIILNSISQGKYISELDDTDGGELATWIGSGLEFMTTKNDLIRAMIRKLQKEEKYERDYIYYYFWDHIVNLNTEPSWIFTDFVKNGLQSRNNEIFDKIKEELEWSGDPEHKWLEVFKEELKHFPKIDIEIPPF